MAHTEKEKLRPAFRPRYNDSVLALLSFDAVAEPLWRRMMAEGRLPHCAELFCRGRVYPIESTPLHASVYRSLYTGRSMSAHGSHYPTQWCAAQQRMRLAEPMKPEDSVFARLDGAGKRLLIIDPPECGRLVTKHGLAICGWQFQTRFVLPEWTSSPARRTTLRKRFGPAPGCHEVFGPASLPRLRAMRSVLEQASERLAQAAITCLQEQPFDLVWLTFAAPHLAGHQLWRDSLDQDVATSGEEPSLLASIYERADQALGQILAALPATADVVLFSPLGMGPETSRADLLAEMLERVLRPSAAASHESPLARVRRWVPTGLRARVAEMLPDRVALGLTARLEHGHTDWGRTRAFVVTSDGAGFIRLNLQGREREGIVRPGEAEQLLAEITAGLETFGEPERGKVVRAVLRAADLDTPGPASSLLPDLVVLWAERSSVGLRRVVSPQFGEVLRAGVGSGRVGNHCEGAWACIVPSKAKRAVRWDGPVRAIDFAATACEAMGVDHVDLPGRPLLR